MKRFLYLFQVEHDLPPHLEWAGGADSDVVFLSWRAKSADARSVYYPSSSWTQGRNRLLKAVEGREYQYLIFADDDIHLELTEPGARSADAGAGPWRKFEAFLLDREPAVGCASYDWHLSGGAFDSTLECQTLRFFDALLNAFHREAVPALLPYYDLLDEASECYSQNLLCSLAADLYPGHVMQTNRVRVTNTQARRGNSEFLLSTPEQLYLDSLRDPDRIRRFQRQPIAGAARHPTVGPPLVKRGSYVISEESLARTYHLDHQLWVRRRDLRDLPPDDEFFSESDASARARRWRERRPARPVPPPPPRFPKLRALPLARSVGALVRSPAVRSNTWIRLVLDVARARGRSSLAQAVRVALVRTRSRAWWRAWSRRPDLCYEIPLRSQAELYQLLVSACNRLREKRIVFIDVGAGRGDVLGLLRSHSPRHPVLAIGIDPVDVRGHQSYTGYVVAAITDGPEGTATFFRYSSSDCSSLKRMNTAAITHDRAAGGARSYYTPCEVEVLEETLRVPTLNLSTVIEQYGLAGEVLHFIKIDAQGSDLDVFRSLGESARSCLFLQVETVIPDESGTATTLYDGQTTFAEDRAVIEAAGFRLLNVARFGVTPEADVTFVNTNLFRKLLPDLAR